MRLATRFIAAVAASPFGIPPCPGRQVGEGICPAQDAKLNLPELSHVFKGHGGCHSARLRQPRSAGQKRPATGKLSFSLIGA